MNDETPSEGSLDYAVREYRRLFDEARLEGQPWDQEATLRALAMKTHLTVEELRAAVSPSGSGSGDRASD
ncbi:MAG TPA: hypothetical protein VER03_15635 [Bryobacteraceae bacterium]|nr:hypothetical protein [Bryobacteraceae bacterium]